MKIQIYLILLIFLSISFTSCTKVGHIHGTITDAETGEIIEKAEVEISPGNMSTILTNSTGEFTFADLDEGLYTIKVSKDGYETTSKDFTVDKGSTSQADFTLTLVQQADPIITITSPSNSETWQNGTSHDITWTYSDLEGNVKIELYNNQVLDEIIEGNTECDGSYTWNIPTNQIEGTKYKIKISSLSETEIADESDNFTISAKPQAEVTTLGATNFTINSAQLNGIVNANNNTCTVSFEYGETTDYGTSVNATPETVTGEINTDVYANISELSDNTEYHFRLKVETDDGISYGENMTFTTGSCTVPTVTATTQSNLTETSATLNGTVNANNNETTIVFEWGTSESYGQTENYPNTITGNTTQNILVNIDGLTDGQTYHYRIVETNAGGTEPSNNISFTTGTYTTPTVTIANATNVTETSATLNGTVNANGYDATVTFEYGLTTSYGTTESYSLNPVTGNTAQNVSLNISGLTPEQTYHYRIVATNVGGTQPSGDMPFETLPSYNIIVTSPNGGEEILIANDYNITWQTNISGNVNIYLYKNGTQQTPAIATNIVASNETYTWEVPNLNVIISDDYQIYIESANNTEINDLSNGYFSFNNTSATAVIDYDGNFYGFVTIGNQIWMAENLAVTHYANGTVIPLVTDNTAWANLGDNNTDKAYCWYNNDYNNYGSIYGALYTWAAAS